ncbi:MAG: serine/threonine protein kinase [Planctomycetales bacterium]|nr:serine/threonine protein kinase [Planctomycetales bacterium]
MVSCGAVESMGILDKFKEMFRSNKLDVSARFELDRHATSGTMSNFHLAREIGTGKVFGLKFLDVEKLQAFEARFKGLKKPSEGEISLQFSHPRIVRTYEFGETVSGKPYILMEFVEGQGLNVLIQDKSPLLEGHRVALMRDMAEAIAAVHAAGYIHRDICPRNFIINPQGTHATLIDFGLTVPDKAEFRQPGNRTGTPLYMAPEIVRRRPTDKRVDLFALGVTYYRLLSGEHPWSAGGDTSGMAALQHDTHPPTELLKVRPDVDPRIAKVVMQCLESDREKRPESADVVVRSLKGIEKAYV